MANLQGRFQGIDFEELPKTFREAVILTLGIGISYLWIDSLCIIQDSEADWLHESKHMGDIYKGATLVIAAAGSKDASEGLFTNERPCSPPLRLPYILDGIQVGTFNAVHVPQISDYYYGQLSQTPLRQRAWAFQEWYLSRRKVFFLRNNVYWACRLDHLKEDSRRAGLELEETTSWFALLQEYSDKRLTFANDRLVALQGIVRDSQRDDRWTFGTWEDQIIEHIIWRPMDQAHAKRFPNLPSWCWAASGGQIQFLHGMQPENQTLSHISKAPKINEFGVLHIRGSLLENVFDIANSCEDCLLNHHMQLTSRWDIEFQLLPMVAPDGRIAHRIKGVTLEKTLGLALFDSDENMHSRTILILSKKTRDKGELLYPSDSASIAKAEVSLAHSDDLSKTFRDNQSALKINEYADDIREHSDNPRDDVIAARQGASEDPQIGEPVECHQKAITQSPICSSLSEVGNLELIDTAVEASYEAKRPTKIKDEITPTDDDLYDNDEDTEDSKSSSLSSKAEHPYPDECLNFFDFGISKYIYWGLLLEPIAGPVKQFKRVGVALLYPSAEYLFENKPQTDIEIV